MNERNHYLFEEFENIIKKFYITFRMEIEMISYDDEKCLINMVFHLKKKLNQKDILILYHKKIKTKFKKLKNTFINDKFKNLRFYNWSVKDLQFHITFKYEKE